MLVVIGTGIYWGHLTKEAQGWISKANKILYCVSDPLTERAILAVQPEAESLYPYYDEGKDRYKTYQQMTNRTLECLRDGGLVCVIYYGHPGFFVNPSHEAIKAARAEGFEAWMTPAISTLDCLICDLGIDPASGLQVFEATDLLIRQRNLDHGSHVVILQVSSLGDGKYRRDGWHGKNTAHLKDFLLGFYPPDHTVSYYAAPTFPLCKPDVREIHLSQLDSAEHGGMSTLYVAPLAKGDIYLHEMAKLGLNEALSDVELCPIREDGTSI